LVGTDWEHQKIQNLVGFREISVSHKRKWSPSAIHDDETLGNTSTQSTQQRGKKKEQRERTQVGAQTTKPKVGHKGAKEQIMFQIVHCANSTPTPFTSA
jgi:hypothetical protein